MKKFKLLLVIAFIPLLGGCYWNIWHNTVLEGTNQRVEFHIFTPTPSTQVWAACIGGDRLDDEISEDPYALYDSELTFGSVLDDTGPNGDENTNATATTSSTPSWTDSVGLSLYGVKFENIRIGKDTTTGGPDACFRTSAYGMDERAPWKAKIVAYYIADNGNIKFLTVYTEDEGSCIGPALGGGLSISDALHLCTDGTIRDVLHIYAEEFAVWYP